ncbi:DMT family transporter [Deinococcus sp. QL22]|uniref:DMT family transporter n=1 Tax=Deinococcus sp. QL22 TaxID=2939437 RepID=UPI002017A614|nr:DMT family transporter [Deinococcus sp. QL22]UQN07987.1 DMT family transporter [Deinococcus sp. QL22]
MNEQTRGTVEMTAAMGMLGTIGWFVLRSQQPSIDVVFWRCVFGAFTLLVICVALGLFRQTLTWRQLGIAGLGGMGIVVNWLLLFAAYDHVSIAIATAVYNTQPFILVGFGILQFRETPDASKLLWLAGAFVGVLFIVLGSPASDELRGTFFIGILMALGAAFFWAVAAVTTKHLTGTPPHLIALIQVCIGIVLLAPFAHLSQLPTNTETWAMLITIGVVHTGLLYILMYSAVQRLPTHLQGALSFIYPVVAIAVDVAVLGYRLYPLQIIGMIVVLIAAAATTLDWVLPGQGRAKRASG